MGLPIIQHPTFELTLPSTGEKLRYRPFLVREEKILLLAQSSTEVKDMFIAIEQVLSNCIQDYDVKKFTTFDTEYVFVNLRANSVSDMATLKILDEETEEYIDVQVNLNDVKCDNPESTSLIKINDEIQVQLRYPTYTDILETSDDIMETITKCVDKIYMANGDVLDSKDHSDEEMSEFVNSLPSASFNEMQAFFNNMPSIYLDIEYKVKRKTKTKTLRGIADFF